MEADSPAEPGSRRAWLSGLLLLGYLAFLALPLLDGSGRPGPGLPPVRELTDPRSLLAAATRLGVAAAVELARWVPVGLFSALLFGRPQGWLQQLTRSLLPALALTLALATGVSVL